MSGVEDILAAMQQQHDNSDRTDAELDDIDDMDDIERVRAVFASIDRSDKAALNRMRDNTNLVGAAVHFKDAKLVRELIDAGTDLNVPVTFFDGRVQLLATPLQWAAHCLEFDIVRLLVERGQVSVHSRGSGASALALAAAQDVASPPQRAQQSSVVRFLIARGASTSELDPNGRHFLQFADPQFADLMLDLVRADATLLDRINLDFFAWKLLHSDRSEACVLLELILGRGVVIRQSLYGVPLASVKVVDLLCRNGVDFKPSSSFLTTDCFSRAVSAGRFDVARRLWEAGLVFTQKDSWLYSLPTRGGATVEAIDFLLGLSPDLDVNAVGASLESRPPLLWLMDRVASDDVIAACKRLIAAGANVHATDSNGASLLHLAAARGDISLMQFCVESGCDVDARDKRGRTALMRMLSTTVQKPLPDAIEWLLSRCSTDTLRTATTPQFFYETCSSSSAASVRLLARLGADFNACWPPQGPQRGFLGSPDDSHDKSVPAPARFAASHLFAASASRSAPFPSTPLGAAVRYDCVETVQLLLSLGAKPQSSHLSTAMECRAWKSLLALVSSGLQIDVNVGTRPQHKCLEMLVALCMVGAVSRASTFADPLLFVAACWWGLPIDEELLPATRTRTFALHVRYIEKAHRHVRAWIADQKLALISARATEICVALQGADLPAWQTLMIIDEACPLAPHVAIHLRWRLVTTVKHWKQQ
jgi:ankyrin repeat protein